MPQLKRCVTMRYYLTHETFQFALLSIISPILRTGTPNITEDANHHAEIIQLHKIT